MQCGRDEMRWIDGWKCKRTWKETYNVVTVIGKSRIKAGRWEVDACMGKEGEKESRGREVIFVIRRGVRGGIKKTQFLATASIEAGKTNFYKYCYCFWSRGGGSLVLALTLALALARYLCKYGHRGGAINTTRRDWARVRTLHT